MKKIGLLICYVLLSLNLVAEYTIDGRVKSADQKVSSISLSAGYLGNYRFHRSIVDFDTVYAISIIEKRYNKYAEYPEDGVMMIKLGNDTVYKLFRVPISTIKDSYYPQGSNTMTYVTECLYYNTITYQTSYL